MTETIIRTKERLTTASYSTRRIPRAELADCTCPDFCERDHDNE